MIQPLTYRPNEKVLCEIQAIEGTRSDLQRKVEDSPTLEDYCHSFISSCSGHEFLDKVRTSQTIKVLDIGFGRGETSLYLASQGHEVHCIEPSPLNCEILQNATNKYGQKISIYQGTAENFDQIDEADFDLCLFNSSLHHCDDPIKVLQICQKKLKKSGRVIAINEPILKFYRSKKWFNDKLATDPVAVGHYGGNEHIYYYHEYLSLFKKAGFSSVKGLFHIKNRHPRLVLEEDMRRKTCGKYVCSDSKLLIKFSIFLLLKNLWSPPIIALGKKLSLFSYSFEGRN
jgi:ubiquinone/menaquinone biosynthesis C-methylase UbiE